MLSRAACEIREPHHRSHGLLVPPAMKRIAFWLALGAALVLSRLSHLNVLWSDEDYHLAAAVQLLHGKVLYKEIWYDKPPLSAAFYALLGAPTGLLLRLAGGLFGLGCCFLAYRFASRVWSQREGFIAAVLMAFFLIFYLAPGVIP